MPAHSAKPSTPQLLRDLRLVSVVLADTSKATSFRWVTDRTSQPGDEGFRLRPSLKNAPKSYNGSRGTSSTEPQGEHEDSIRPEQVLKAGRYSEETLRTMSRFFAETRLQACLYGKHADDLPEAKRRQRKWEEISVKVFKEIHDSVRLLAELTSEDDHALGSDAALDAFEQRLDNMRGARAALKALKMRSTVRSDIPASDWAYTGRIIQNLDEAIAQVTSAEDDEARSAFVSRAGALLQTVGMWACDDIPSRISELKLRALPNEAVSAHTDRSIVSDQVLPLVRDAIERLKTSCKPLSAMQGPSKRSSNGEKVEHDLCKAIDLSFEAYCKKAQDSIKLSRETFITQRKKLKNGKDVHITGHDHAAHRLQCRLMFNEYQAAKNGHDEITASIKEFLPNGHEIPSAASQAGIAFSTGLKEWKGRWDACLRDGSDDKYMEETHSLATLLEEARGPSEAQAGVQQESHQVDRNPKTSDGARDTASKDVVAGMQWDESKSKVRAGLGNFRFGDAHLGLSLERGSVAQKESAYMNGDQDNKSTLPGSSGHETGGPRGFVWSTKANQSRSKPHVQFGELNFDREVGHEELFPHGVVVPARPGHSSLVA